MRAGTEEFLYSMTCLPSPFLVIVRANTGDRQGPREVRPSPDHTSYRVFGIKTADATDSARRVAALGQRPKPHHHPSDGRAAVNFTIQYLRLHLIFNIYHIGVFLKTSLTMFAKSTIYGRLCK